MKTKLLLSTLLSFYFYLLSSQIPQGFNYQAIARDATTHNPIINTALPVRITVQSDSLGGTVFWQELHSSVTTNSFGLFNLVLGKGSKTDGIASSFENINWSVTPKFIMTEIDHGGWINMGSSRLWTVPYAMVAGDLNDTLKKLIVKSQTSVMDESLFEVKNKDGQTVFAVYNEGVRIYVDDHSKGVKGGFAVGGFGPDKAGNSQKYLFVSGDSIRAYIFDDPLIKTAKGGFSIGGFNLAKKPTNDYLLISADSSRVYVNNAPSTKGAKGGFAIGGFDPTTKGKKPQKLLTVSDDSIRMYINDTGLKTAKGGFAIGGFNTAKGPLDNYLKVDIDKIKAGKIDYLNITPLNTFIGSEAGKINTTGQYNSFIGYQAGQANSEGSSNVFLGYLAGYSNDTAKFNVLVGNESGFSNVGTFNTFLGYRAGYHNTSGGNNVFLGYEAGYSNYYSYNNVYIGYRSGRSNYGGHDNVFLGSEAGFTNTIGYNNIFIGKSAGKANTKGLNNVFLGQGAGNSNTEGNGNVFFGNNSGDFNTTGNANVFIGSGTGAMNISGTSNVYLGGQAGFNGIDADNNVIIGKTSGFLNRADSNIFIGVSAGYGHVLGEDNIYMGSKSGFNNGGGTKNILLGYKSGYSSYLGENNVILGTEAGYNNWADNNIFIGNKAGYNNNLSDANFNIFLGSNAGLSNTGGNSSIYIGQNAGQYNASGTDNTIIGSNAGSGSSFVGSGNVLLGSSAGSQESSINNKLFIDNSGTSSPLIFGDFTDGSEKLAFNAKVGIGTNNPSERLEIGGTNSQIFMNSFTSNIMQFNQQGEAPPSANIRSLGTKLVLYPNMTVTTSDYALGIESKALWYSVPYNDNTYSHRFYAGATELMRIRGDGNVGIGTNNPGQRLEIGGNNSQIFMNSNVSNMLLFNQYGKAAPAFTTRSDGTKLVLAGQISGSSADYALGIEPGALWFSVPDATTNNWYAFYGGTSEIMRIRGDGNVGIGTTDPSYKLDVTGSARTTADTYLATSSGSVGIGTLYPDASYKLDVAGIARTTANTYLATGSGSVGVGTTTPNAAYKLDVFGKARTFFETYLATASGSVGVGTINPDPAYKLDVAGTVRNTENAFLATLPGRHVMVGSETVSTYTFDVSGTARTLFDTYLATSAGSYVGIGTTNPQYTLDVRGTIGNNTTLYHSDLRWKTNIEPVQYGIADLLKLNGVSYLWNAKDFPEMKFEDGPQIGFIAQEFEKIIPELVRTDKDGYKSIDYVKLTPVLVEGIKEQQKIINNQQTTIESLKVQMSLLQEKIDQIETLLTKKGTE